ncbi:hypothetical protein DDE84_01815 [Bifidobacterium tibiigranuli]|jgi:hypothetical protein|uniref:Uncharacterized protein n=1 Tax=Bifidobacterium tibiigranuli TaxID=2172043 RepID=A0A5N6S7W6_9BIFI|nr:hypothetical protein DDE84_01815 [Bifidobacterium tibiigranuli]KAE8129939.1 hypothetical protein DDF78_02440 [Bifidobacterium tibiigranuli]
MHRFVVPNFGNSIRQHLFFIFYRLWKILFVEPKPTIHRSQASLSPREFSVAQVVCPALLLKD